MGPRIEIDSETQRLSDQLSLKLTHHPNIDLQSKPSSEYDFPRLWWSEDDVRTTLKVLFDLHDKNISLLTLDLSNIIVTDHEGILKFRGLVFISSSSESKKNDFILLADLIYEKYWNRWLPEESVFEKDLFELMLNFRDSDRDLLLNHVALKATDERLSFLKNISDNRKFLAPEINRRSNLVFADMDKASKGKDWRKEIEGSNEIGVKECFNFQPAECRPANYGKNISSKLRFGRNFATHGPEYLLKAGWSKDTVLDETYRIVIKYFGTDLLTFQKLAYQKGILEYFMPGYRSSKTTTQTRTSERQDYNKTDGGGSGGSGGGGGGGGGQRTHHQPRAVAESNGYIRGG